jgi:hypothetical protein
MNPYETLGARPGAGPAEVRQAWRRRALETHPDLGGDAGEFLRARQAFVRLRSPPATPGAGPAPTVARRLGPPALALRWWRRRQSRTQHPRVR